MTRRDFLRLAGAGLGAAALAACAPGLLDASDEESVTGEPEVIVVGAGVAGLKAAADLRALGYSVLVLEGRDRIGGRVWTDRSLGMPLDLGASWIHGVSGNPIHALARQQGVRMAETDYDNMLRFDYDGRELEDDEDVAVDAQLEDFAAFYEEFSEAAEDDDSLQAVANAWQARIRLSAFGQRAFQYALNTNIEHEFAADVRDLSMWYFDESDAFGGEDVIFPDGYDWLVQALAAGLSIRTGHVVRGITSDAEGVRVSTSQGTYTAQGVVITLPLGVLQSGNISVPLSSRQQQAVQALGMGLLNKTYLQFDKPFWGADYDMLGYLSESKGQWCEWLNVHKPTGQPVLLGFNAADYGRALEGRTDKAIVADAMQALRAMYGSGVPDPRGYVITRWAQDPFALGAYSYVPPFASPEDYEALAVPVNSRVVLAGEHTHAQYPSTVHGAFLSGVRAAEQLDEELP